MNLLRLAAFGLGLAVVSVAAATEPKPKLVRYMQQGTITVVDERGQPVPAASVWCRSNDDRDFEGKPNPWFVSAGQFERLIERYGGTAEFSDEWMPGGASQNAMTARFTDRRGTTTIRFSGTIPTAQALDLSCVAARFDWTPASVRLSLDVTRNEFDARITLFRKRGTLKLDGRYVRDYETVLIDGFADNPALKGNLNPVREALLKAAASAEKSGDKAWASRMLTYAPMLRTTITIDKMIGTMRVSGYEAESRASERNLAVLKRAVALDPDNATAAMLLARGQTYATLEAQILAYEAVLRRSPNAIWPEFMVALEKLYGRVGRLGDARALYERVHLLEPDHWENRNDWDKRRFAAFATIEEFEARIVKTAVDEYDFSDDATMIAVRAGRVDLFEHRLAHGARRPLQSYLVIQAAASTNPLMLERVLRERAEMKYSTLKFDRERVCRESWQYLPVMCAILRKVAE